MDKAGADVRTMPFRASQLPVGGHLVRPDKDGRRDRPGRHARPPTALQHNIEPALFASWSTMGLGGESSRRCGRAAHSARREGAGGFRGDCDWASAWRCASESHHRRRRMDFTTSPHRSAAAPWSTL